MPSASTAAPAYVQPVIVIPADPRRDPAYEEEVDGSFRRLAAWFGRVAGRPLNYLPPTVCQLLLEEEQWLAKYAGDPVRLWKDGISEAADRGLVEGKCNLALLKHYEDRPLEQQSFPMWGTVMFNWWSWQENQPESITAPGFAPFEKEWLLASSIFH